MVKIASIGVVSAGCGTCEKLKEKMRKKFGSKGVTLEFVEVSYEADPKYAISVSEEMGFDDLPSFEVAGVVFQDGFADSQVAEAMARIR